MMSVNHSGIRPNLDRFEDRLVPAVTIREAAGANAAAIQAAVDAFRLDLGTLNANNPGSVGSGRREINWDANAPLDASSSPTAMSGSFFNQATSPFARGAVFSTPGTGVIVSQDNDTPADADPDQLRFDDFGAGLGYSTQFQTFSAQRLFAAKSSNIIETTFRIPGGTRPAQVRGFGAVFCDVDVSNATKLECFDVNGKTVFSREVIPSGGAGGFSFLGASFAAGDAERIAKVRLTLGNGILGTGQDISVGGISDLVVLDDFIYAEPTQAPLPIIVGNGVGRTAQFHTPNGGLSSALSPFGELATGGVRAVRHDFDQDGIPDVVAGTGPGSPTKVRIIAGKDNTTELFTIDPFEASFTGGVFVAAGDINNDGVPDLVIAPDEGGGPRVRVFSGKGFGQIADFLAIEDPAFRGGARPTVGDINGDSFGDLVVAAGFGGGPRIAGYDGKLLTGTGGPKIFGDFLAFEEALRNGSYVAVGDIDGDNKAELIAGGGPGGGPRVSVFKGSDLLTNVLTRSADFFAGSTDNRGGIRVAINDQDGDNQLDLVTGDGPSTTLTPSVSRVRTYLGKTLTGGTPPEQFNFEPFSGLTGGVFVG